MRYFARLDPRNVVQRVIVAESVDDCLELAGGTVDEWVETIQGHSTERYAGPGMVYVSTDPRVFLSLSEV